MFALAWRLCSFGVRLGSSSRVQLVVDLDGLGLVDTGAMKGQSRASTFGSYGGHSGHSAAARMPSRSQQPAEGGDSDDIDEMDEIDEIEED
jgi:hypothetical protein